MTVRLLLDEMYPPKLADTLRDKGHDVIAVAASVDFVGSDDATGLDIATGDGRCLVTEHVRDFAMLVRHTSHGGVLFVHAKRWRRTRVGLHRLVDALHDAISGNRIPDRDDVRWLDRVARPVIGSSSFGSSGAG